MYLHEIQKFYNEHSDGDGGHFDEKSLTKNHPLLVLKSISIVKVTSHV